MKSLSCVRLVATLWTVPYPGSSVHRVLQARILLQGIEPGSPALQAGALTSEPLGKPAVYSKQYIYIYILL